MTILTELNNPNAVTALFNAVYVISKNFYTYDLRTENENQRER